MSCIVEKRIISTDIWQVLKRILRTESNNYFSAPPPRSAPRRCRRSESWFSPEPRSSSRSSTLSSSSTRSSSVRRDSSSFIGDPFPQLRPPDHRCPILARRSSLSGIRPAAASPGSRPIRDRQSAGARHRKRARPPPATFSRSGGGGGGAAGGADPAARDQRHHQQGPPLLHHPPKRTAFMAMSKF